MAAKKKTAAKRKAAPKRKTAAKKKAAGRRELIDTGTNKLFVRRNERGTSFKEGGRRGQVDHPRQADEGQAKGAFRAGRQGRSALSWEHGSPEMRQARGRAAPERALPAGADTAEAQPSIFPPLRATRENTGGA